MNCAGGGRGGGYPPWTRLLGTHIEVVVLKYTSSLLSSKRKCAIVNHHQPSSAIVSLDQPWSAINDQSPVTSISHLWLEVPASLNGMESSIYSNNGRRSRRQAFSSPPKGYHGTYATSNQFRLGHSLPDRLKKWICTLSKSFMESLSVYTSCLYFNKITCPHEAPTWLSWPDRATLN